MTHLLPKRGRIPKSLSPEEREARVAASLAAKEARREARRVAPELRKPRGRKPVDPALKKQRSTACSSDAKASRARSYKKRYAARRAEYEAGRITASCEPRTCVVCHLEKEGDAFELDLMGAGYRKSRCRTCEAARQRRKAARRRERSCAACGSAYTAKSKARTLCGPCRTLRCSAAQCEQHRMPGRLRCPYHHAVSRGRRKDDDRKVYASDARALAAKYDGHCYYTGLPFSQTNPPIVEHLVAVANGGSNCAENLVWACERANTMKGAMSMREFVAMCRLIVTRHPNT